MHALTCFAKLKRYYFGTNVLFHNKYYFCLKLICNWLDKSKIFFNITCKVITLISFFLNIWRTVWLWLTYRPFFKLNALFAFFTGALHFYGNIVTLNRPERGPVWYSTQFSFWEHLQNASFLCKKKHRVNKFIPFFAFNTDLIEQRTGMYIKLPINNDNQIWMLISIISAIKLRVELTRIETFFTYSLEFKGQLYGNEGRHIRVHDVRSVHGNIGSVNVHTE